MAQNQTPKRKGSLPTATDGHQTFNFDGVFRDVNDPNTRQRLYTAQASVKDGNWEEAKTILRTTASELETGHDRRNLEIVLKEIEYYQKNVLDASVDAAVYINWMDVTARKPKMYFENFNEIPQSIFIIKPWMMSDVSNRIILGRRILSHQWISNKIRELHCSHIRASMILGLMVDHRVQEDGVAVYYYPLTAEEKKFYMSNVIDNRLADMEIVFPYPALQTSFKTEIHCPDEGWEIDETLALQLGEGEVILREYSVKFLKGLGREDLFLFDPACSTGQFLSTMKKALPNSYTAGQDLSPCMAKYAKARLDETHCANALDSQIQENTADVEFIRFINSEVLKTGDARIMINPLLSPLKKNGHMVIFGHTPVLVSAADLMMNENLEILQAIGADSDGLGIFQFYVCRKL